MQVSRFPRGRFDDLTIVLCGAAGQGVQTVEEMLVRLGRTAGYHVFASREYMSRVRGGNNSTTLRLSPRPVRALVDRIDLLVPLSPGLRKNILARIDPDTVVLLDRESLGGELDDCGARLLPVSFSEMAREAGGKAFENMVALAVVAGVLGVPLEGVETLLRERFERKHPEMLDKNRAAVRQGYPMGRRLAESDVPIGIPLSEAKEERVVLDGSDAVSVGALAGGCNFCCAYPMSPATGVFQFMVKQAHTFGVVVEQVEDEIAGINMAVGASYAGARPMVTTSGGGFALMTEGLSLAGVMETPVVVHLAQRPGPATGMATRTEQADLELVLYAGHGEFPRALLAPGTLEEAVRCTRHAFEQAAKYQTPAIVLTDQYFVNTYYDLEPPTFAGSRFDTHLVASTPDYRRYEEAADGLSPRSVPGYGEGLVGADSHEHDEEGHIDEDFDLRTRMNAKRLRKYEGLRRDALPPTRVGDPMASTLVVAWGSTRPMIEEALERLGRRDVALLHLCQLWPLHPQVEEEVLAAKRLVLVEGNATGQLGRLLRQETGRKADASVRNWRGLQFSVEELERALGDVLEKGGADA